MVSLLGCLASPTAAASLEEIVGKVQERYEKLTDIKADFLQEATIKSMNKTDREEGVFYFKNPRRMVWDYMKPKTKKLVVNPQTAWLYVPEDGVVYVQKTGSFFKSKASMRFLSGMGNIGEDFRVSFAEPDKVDKGGNYLLKLVPRERDLGIEEFFVTIDKDQFFIIQLSFADSFGNKTRLQFRNIKSNNGLAEKLFTFSPPAGVEIYNNP